ncbi:MAG TPA: hypothetical protein VF177_15065 [Anaerolineae bacterium]
MNLFKIAKLATWLALALLWVACAADSDVVEVTRRVTETTAATAHFTSPPTPQPSPTPEPTATVSPMPTPLSTPPVEFEPALESFLESLQHNLNERNFDLVESEMRSPFVAGIYPAAISTADVRDVVAHLESRLLPQQPSVAFRELDEAALPDNLMIAALFDDEASGVTVTGSSGWGLAGSGEGLLYIVEEASLYRWAGLIVTYGDFIPAPAFSEMIAAPAGLVYQVKSGGHDHIEWWQVAPDGQPELLIERNAPLSLNPGATLALQAESGDQFVTLFHLLNDSSEIIPVNGRVMASSSSIPWLDEKTAVLLITSESQVSQGTVGHPALLNTDTGQLTILEPELSIYAQPSVTAPGTAVFGVSIEDELLTWRNGQTMTVPIAGLGDEIEHFANPVLSPDGAKVTGTGGVETIPHTFGYVVASMEQPLHALVHTFTPVPTDAVIPWGITWSPDSQWLALSPPSWDVVETGVWLVAADGAAKIYLGPGTGSPVWIDAERVVFTAIANGKAGLQLCDMATRERFWLDLPMSDAGPFNGFWLDVTRNVSPVQHIQYHSLDDVRGQSS